MTIQHHRARMIEEHLAGRGITDPKILAAFQAVPREAFVHEGAADLAYADTPLPIGHGQTISQPYIVALTIEALQLHGGERVLEIGAGSGYAAAVLSRIAGEVFTVERLPPLCALAESRLERLGFTNVRLHCGDGSLGWPEHASYDAIAVAAAGPEVPPALLAQLAVGGRLVMPVGPDNASQVLIRVTRVSPTELRREELADVRFVPLIGEQAWEDESQVIRSRRGGRESASSSSDRTTRAIDLILRFAERTAVGAEVASAISGPMPLQSATLSASRGRRAIAASTSSPIASSKVFIAVSRIFRVIPGGCHGSAVFRTPRPPFTRLRADSGLESRSRSGPPERCSILTSNGNAMANTSTT